MTRLALSFVLGLATSVVAQQSDTVVLSLPSLVSIALQNNLDLRAARVAPRLAGADLLSARGSFDPTLTLASGLSSDATDAFGVAPRTTLSSNAHSATLGTTLPVGSQFALTVRNSSVSLDPFVVSSTQPFPTSHASSVGFSLTQPLLRGFGRVGTYGLVDAATVSIESARDRVDRSADVVVAQVERGYWVLRQTETNESVAQQSVDAARAIYERNVALQQRDVATQLDVLTSERSLATRETQLLEFKRQRVDAADRLLFLVYGEDARGSTILHAASVHTARDTVVVPTIPTLDDAERLALSLRPDAAAASRDVDANRRRVEQSRNQRLPRVDLVAGYGYGGTAPTTRFLSYADSADLRQSTWSLGFNVSFLARNDAARAVDERALAALELARMSQLATDNAVRADVRSAVRALETARSRYLRAGDVGALAEKEYATAREGARLGLISTFQLLQYEDALAQARLLVAQARFALEDAGSQYRLAVGNGRRAYQTAGAP